MPVKHVGLIAASIAFTPLNIAFAQELLPTDLSTHAANTSISYSIEAGNHRVVVRNVLPSQRDRYTVSVIVGNTPIPPLTLDEFEPRMPEITLTDEDCTRLKAAYDSLRNASVESEVPSRVRALEEALDDSSCSEDVQAAARVLLASTTIVMDRVHSVRVGQQVTVTVTKGGTDGEAVTTWTSIYSTGSRGTWRATYGFSFVTDWLSDNETYYADEVGEGLYEVAAEKNREPLTFIPSLFFSWLPVSSELRTWSTSLTAGLGFDLSAPVVFLGGAITYNQNLSVSSGVALHQQQVLRGRYVLGDTIQANLTEDQLHSKAYRPNIFVSVALRFGANPFARRDEL